MKNYPYQRKIFFNYLIRCVEEFFFEEDLESKHQISKFGNNEDFFKFRNLRKKKLKFFEFYKYKKFEN